MKHQISGFFIFLCALLAIPTSVYSNDKAGAVIQYILSHQKQNGAFGPHDMQYTDLAWTYPAVHALKLLGVDSSLYKSAYISGGKAWIEKAKWKNGPWYWSLHQKVNLYMLMNGSGELENDFPHGKPFTVSFKHRKSYLESRSYLDGYFFDMASLWNLIEAIDVMNGVIENKESIVDHVIPRQADNGGFDDMLGTRSSPDNNKTHLLVTHDAVMILKTLGIKIPDRDKLVKWVKACQDEEGGFRWSPDNDSYSNKPDVWYTWAALKTLKILGEEPDNPETCLRWLNALQNSDGGFGDKPGWGSRIYSTYYAVHSIEMLSGNLKQNITGNNLTVVEKEHIPEGKYSIFQAHHKSPSGGNEMVDSVVSMGFNLIGVKTTEKEVISSGGMSKVVENARNYAREKGYDIEILDNPENYAHKIQWFSGMDGDHCSNMLLPPDMTEAEWEEYLYSYNEGLKKHSWDVFKSEVVAPAIEKMKTLFYPELDYTMMNAYMVYDEGLDGNIGYNAVPAAHFGNIDWVRHFPYKERWLGKLPMIADGDAHAKLEKWKPNLDYFRNIYIAETYHYDAYIDASLNGRSVCVIRMPDTNEIRYYGSTVAVEYLKKHTEDWKWW